MNGLKHCNIYLWVLLIILCINFGVYTSLHGQQFNKYLDHEASLLKSVSDSSVLALKKQKDSAFLNYDTTQMIKGLIDLSTIERMKKNYGAAFDHSGEALFLAEQFNDTLLMAKAHEELGALNYLYKQDDEAGSHFLKSIDYYKKAHQNNPIPSTALINPYYNLLLYYQRIKDYVMTKAYIDTCYSLTIELGLDNLNQIYLNEKRANLLRWDSKFNKAIELIDQSIWTIENLETKEKNQHKSFLIVLFATKGNIYKVQGKFAEAKQFLEKSIQEKDLYGEHTFYKAFVYRTYASLLYDLGEYQKSYDHLLEAQIINNTYLNPRNESTQGFLSIKNRYREELSGKSNEINAKNLELAKSKEENLRFKISLFLSVFIIIVVVLVSRVRIQHLKHVKENEENLQKQEQSAQMIEQQNKELTTNILQLIEKEEVIKALSDQLERDPSNKALLSSIKKRSVSLWEAFNRRFIALNGNFYERLQQRVPDLGSSDLKICALIKLNFSGKEMAYLLGISAGSVNVARHRLRKKMNLNRDVNLTQFINSI